MKATIIIPTYNVEKYIEQCINSVILQTEKDIEIILIDDCSSDSTTKIIEEYAKNDTRINLIINEKNSGPSHSRNKGLQAAKGKFIAFLDSDDWWDEERLEKMLQHVENFNADMICDDQKLINDNEEKHWGTIFKNGKVYLNKPLNFTASYFINHDLGLKPLIRREFIEQNQIRFDENLRYGEDYLLFLNCLMLGANAYLIPEAYYYYRAREGSLVTKNMDLLKQTLNTTENMLNNPFYNKDHEVKRALENRKKRIIEAIEYYSFTQPIKDGDYLQGIKSFIRSPRGAFLIIKRLPRVLNNRIIRKFKRNEAE